MESWPVNIVGLGLIVAGILFAYFLNFVGIIIGLIMVIGGIMALWMTYRRKKYATPKSRLSARQETAGRRRIRAPWQSTSSVWVSSSRASSS